ncbi:MAG: amidohydrolase family protein [Lachnospiraceae bacterium]|nr:amidohydrolase family protein [Lachnospiraceae bacterium]
MIIDIHTHSFPDKIAKRAVASLQEKSGTKIFTDGTVGGLMARDERVGIDLSVVLPVATAARQVEHINDSALRENELHFTKGEEPKGILSLGCMHPEYETPERELKRIKEEGLLGIKLHPVYQGVDIDSLPFLKILDLCAELDLIVITHAGWDIGFPGGAQALPSKIRTALRTVDPEGKTLRFVAAHMGGWKIWDEVAENLLDTGAYLDTAISSGHLYPIEEETFPADEKPLMGPEAFLSLIRTFGADRILFGSDNPWTDAAETLRFLNHLPLTDVEKKKIFGENAKALLRL